ncbi:MAG TPA: response regulator [Rhodocyclaceae bacterium]|nr:response regulator [Rhodocyclaceae bacterium]
MPQILVVDDEIGIRELLSEILTDEGYDVLQAEKAAVARELRDQGRPDLVLLDIWMPDMDGITLLKEWAAAGQLNMPVIMMSGHGTIETAVEATRIGAMDFLEKPIGMQKLLAAVKRGLERHPKPGSNGLSLAAFPRSAPLRDLKKRLEQLAAKSSVLLLRSTPGGIVELAARSLHTPGRPWIDLAHHPEPLNVETLAATAGGLLYCEELARLTKLQQKNLVFALVHLERHNLRLVAGSSHDVPALVQQGWDEGVLRRLHEVWLGLPALAELRDEIPDLASHILTRLVEAEDVPLRQFSTAALNALRQYPWSGGYGELKSAVRSLALAALEAEISVDEVQQLLHPEATGEMARPALLPEVMELQLREAREIFERTYFEYHLRLEGGNMTRLAEKTGLERTHLYRKLKDLGLRGGKAEE